MTKRKMVKYLTLLLITIVMQVICISVIAPTNISLAMAVAWIAGGIVQVLFIEWDA